MSADTVEKLITNAIHAAFIKYPEGDGGPNLDYEWIRLSTARILPRRFFWIWRPMGLKLLKV